MQLVNFAFLFGLTLLTIFVSSLAKEGAFAGVLYIRLQYYSQRDNHHCDLGPWRLNVNNDRCDPYFIIQAGPAGRQSLGSFESNPFDNAHQTLQFGSTLGQLTNPVAFSFRDSDGMNASDSAALEIGVTVKDHDPHTQDDLMEQFHWSLPVFNVTSIGNGGLNTSTDGPYSGAVATSAAPTAGLLTGSRLGDLLALEAWTVCRPGRYGPGCGVACQPVVTPAASYGCDRATGERVCLPGYADPGGGCARRDACATDGGGVAACANGGDCIDDAVPRCRCRDGFTGRRCETLARPCGPGAAAAAGCARGVCVRAAPVAPGAVAAAAECVCEKGFQGDRCDRDINECSLLSPCMHGATCVNTIGSFACTCRPGYTGHLCQLPPMVLPPEAAAASAGAVTPLASADGAQTSGSVTLITAVLASVIALLLLCLTLLLLHHRRSTQSTTTKSAAVVGAVAWHRRPRRGQTGGGDGDGGGSDSDSQSCYESVDDSHLRSAAATAPAGCGGGGGGGSNPYYEMDAGAADAVEIEEEEDSEVADSFANAAYAMETTPLRALPPMPRMPSSTPPPPSPPPRRPCGTKAAAAAEAMPEGWV